MEQLNVKTQQDNEKVFRILSDLLTNNKEFSRRDTGIKEISHLTKL